MNLGRILFLAIFMFSSSTVLAMSSFAEKIINDSALSIQDNTAMLDQLGRQNEMKEQYRRQLTQVFNEFSGKNASFDNLEEALLGLTVPAEYRNLHFDLVAAIDQLTGKEPSATSAKSQLERLKDTYSWLAANLSLLIANSF